MAAFRNFLTQLARNVFPRVPTAPAPTAAPTWIHSDALLLSLLHTPSRALNVAHLTLSRVQLSSLLILRTGCIVLQTHFETYFFMFSAMLHYVHCKVY